MRRAGLTGTHARPAARTLARVHDRAPELGHDDAVVLRELLDELRASFIFDSFGIGLHADVLHLVAGILEAQ